MSDEPKRAPYMEEFDALRADIIASGVPLLTDRDIDQRIAEMREAPSEREALNCDICKGALNTGDVEARDCGGTCLRCMAVIGEDPECIEALAGQ